MEDEVICAEGCDSSLPAVDFNVCAPEWRKSEFIGMALGRADTPAFTFFGSAVEWAARVSSDATEANKIRLLTIRGNKPATTKTTIALTNKRSVNTNRRHVVNIVIDEVNDTNYDFARSTQCGAVKMRAWFITDDGNELQGGNSGILGTIFLEAIYDEGDGAIQRFAGTFEWDAKQDPARVANPIAGYEGAGSSS